MIRSITVLNRNEYAMSREDDFAQTASVRRFVETGAATETEMFRMGINASEPFRTITFTDDPEELAALASQSTKAAYWVAYADGRIIAKQPTGHGAFKRVQDALNGYIATQRIIYGKDVEAATMDKVSAHHFDDTPPVPLSTPCGDLTADATQDRVPREVRWLYDVNEVIIPTEDDDFVAVPAVWFDEADMDLLPYVEGVSEAAAMGYRAFTPAPTCD